MPERLNYRRTLCRRIDSRGGFETRPYLCFVAQQYHQMPEVAFPLPWLRFRFQPKVGISPLAMGYASKLVPTGKPGAGERLP